MEYSGLLEKYGFFAGSVVIIGFAVLGGVKAWFDSFLRQREKKSDSDIKIAEQKAIADIERQNKTIVEMNKGLERTVLTLQQENDTFKEAIKEIKEAHATAIHEFMAQIEELKEANDNLHILLREKEQIIATLSNGKSRIADKQQLLKNRFFLKMEEFLYKLTSSPYADSDIFRYVAHKIIIVKYDWEQFVENWKGFENGKEGLERAVFQHITDQIKSYKEWAIKHKLDTLRTTAYDTYHERRINYIFDVNKQIIFSNLYLNNLERFDALLSFWVSVFQIAVENAHDFMTRDIQKSNYQINTKFDEELDEIFKNIGLE